MRRSAQDLVSLSREAQRSAQAQQSSQSSGDKRELQDQADRQSDLADGVSRVADSLAALSEKTPFLNPSISRSLGKAMQGLQQSSRELSQGNRARGQMQGQDAAARLNEAVNALRDAEQSMCSKPGQGPMGKGAGEKLGPMGQRQSQLNQRGRELAQRLTQQMRISAGDRAEMRALADAQRRLREELEQVQRDEQRHPSLLGRLDQARRDMKDAEDALEKGDVGPDLQDRQQRILSRLLDAQRSVNRRDLDPQREAELARDLAHPSPGALPAEALRENDRLRLDLLKAAADRYPAQYRAFIQRYLEALNRSHP